VWCGVDSRCISYGKGCRCGCAAVVAGIIAITTTGIMSQEMAWGWAMDPPVPLIDVEDEIKMLEEYKDALTKQLERVNKRLEGFKR
jgi:hypothetical protein